MAQKTPKGFINDESGSAHVTRENEVGDSYLTCHSGVTEPTYAEAGTKWMDTSASPWTMKRYDGTDWITEGTVDPTGNSYLAADSDKLDGYDAGNSDGNIPISNGTVNDNLNAEMVGGRTSEQIAPTGRFDTLTVKSKTGFITTITEIIAEIIALYDADDAPFTFHDVSKEIDIATSGVGGLDTGSVSTDTWYFIWLIAKEDGTINALFSLSDTAPTMPAGYTYKVLVGAQHTESFGGPFFEAIYQTGKYATVAQKSILALGAETTLTTIDLTDFVPSTAKRVFGTVEVRYVTGVDYVTIVFPYAGIFVDFQAYGTPGSAAEVVRSYFNIMCIGQTFQYIMDSGDGNVTINLSGWEY